jgi:hypothetical protein
MVNYILEVSYDDLQLTAIGMVLLHGCENGSGGANSGAREAE